MTLINPMPNKTMEPTKTTELSQEDKDLLVRMTGSEKKKMQGYRNYGVFEPGSPSHERVERLVKMGMAKFNRKSQNVLYYSVTQLGCESIGMTKVGMKRALDRESRY